MSSPRRLKQVPSPSPDRVATCGCVWRHFPRATQGWKWKCIQRCPDHDASAGHVVPQETG